MLSAAGKTLTTSACRHQGKDGNGIGVAAAPSIGDLDGDGTLEIVLTTFDHGLDVYRVPGSGTPAAVADRARQPAPQRDRVRRRRPELRRGRCRVDDLGELVSDAANSAFGLRRPAGRTPYALST